MFNSQHLEAKIKDSHWWVTASNTKDNHFSPASGIMISDHLLAVYNNIETIFNKPSTGFYGDLFALLPSLQLNINEIKEELKITALLHDIGKPNEDRSLVIPHPLTGKPAHKRHGLVGLMAAMEIMGDELADMPEKRNRIYRTIELHDMSYGLFREFINTGDIPQIERWNYINNKIHTLKGCGLLYLLIFKLADIDGHAKITDVTWFYNTVKDHYFDHLQINLPMPTEADIR